MTAAVPASALSRKAGDEYRPTEPRINLHRWPGNPRTHFDEVKLAELAKSLAGAHGMIEPIVARPHPSKAGALEIAAGERRWRASGLAKLETVPVIVRQLNEQQMLELATIENAQREDLTPIEQAAGYERLIKEFGYTVEKIAEAIGKSRAHVFQIRKLNDLAPKLRERFADGEMDTTLATVFARVPGHALQEKAWTELKQEFRDGFNFRAAAQFVRENYMLDLGRAPFPIHDATLYPKAGECSKCPKRTGNQPDLFNDVKNGNVCTDPGCFQAKRATHQQRQVKKAEEKGTTVIAGEAAKRILPHEHSRLWSGNGYAAPSEQCHEDSKRRTYGQLAKAAGLETVKVQSPHHGELLDAVPTTALSAALQKAGIKLAGPRSSASDETYRARQRAIEQRHKLESQARKLILARIHNEARRVDLVQPRVLTLIICGAWRHMWHELRKRLAASWGWGDKYPGHELKPARLKGISADDLARMVIDCALAHLSTPSSSAAELAAAARIWRVQDGKIRATVQREAREKKAAKASAAKARAKPKAKGTAKRRPSSFMRPLQASPALAAIVGSKPLARTEITKKVWTYIQRNKLQDKKNKRLINSDAKLKPLFKGRRQVSLFEMTKYLSAQLSEVKS